LKSIGADKSLEYSATLPRPMSSLKRLWDLEAALQQFAAIANDLRRDRASID
jgi:hypothetical protein